MNKGTQLLDLYKIHAELADKVSQRREGANRLYVTLFAAWVGGFSALVEFQRGGEEMEPVVAFAFGAFGAVLSFSWLIVIRSYRQLNTGKFAVLHELEEKLPYPFFKREWELVRKESRWKRYWRLTVAETILPCAFLLLSCGVAVWPLVT